MANIKSPSLFNSYGKVKFSIDKLVHRQTGPKLHNIYACEFHSMGIKIHR